MENDQSRGRQRHIFRNIKVTRHAKPRDRVELNFLASESVGLHSLQRPGLEVDRRQIIVQAAPEKLPRLRGPFLVAPAGVGLLPRRGGEIERAIRPHGFDRAFQRTVERVARFAAEQFFRHGHDRPRQTRLSECRMTKSGEQK